jgi:hypothetical protein
MTFGTRSHGLEEWMELSRLRHANRRRYRAEAVGKWHHRYDTLAQAYAGRLLKCMDRGRHSGVGAGTSNLVG